MYRIILSLLLIMLGAAVTLGGGYLAYLGGSPFYVALGLSVGVAGILILRRNPAGLGVYAAALIATLVWAVWEVGFDWWALSARGSLLVLLGILLLPVGWRWTRQDRVIATGLGARRAEGPAVALALAVVVSAGIAGYAMTQAPHDLAGEFPADRMAGAALPDDGNAGDWASYGRTAKGQRYSPLDQITPANVAGLTPAWTFNTGQIRDGSDPVETTYEVTPLVVNDTMFLCTPFSTVRP